MRDGMFNEYFPLFWIEVAAFNSLLAASASAKLTCCGDFTKSGVEFTLKSDSHLLKKIAWFASLKDL